MKSFLHLFPGRAEWTNWAITAAILCFLPLLAIGSNPNELSLSVNVTGTNIMCGGFSTGSATASAWGGISPYSYHWNTGATTPTISNLPAGTYSVTVTDALNAQTFGSITLTQPTPLSGTVSTTCGNPGTATANPVGGVPGYTYLWSNGATSQTIVNLPPGQYCVTITDANSCGVVACGNTGTGPSVAVTTTNAGCNGGNAGTATANPSSGTPPYSYVWSNGGTTQTITNLPAGSYSVTVTDSGGCTGTASGVVQSSNNGFPIWLTTTPPSSCSSNNGVITANPQGGVAPYTYAWSNGGTTQTINNLGPGIYTVTITDAVGCSASKSATLSAPSNVSAWVSATDESCPGANNGTATASGMGGVQPYSYIWSNGQSGATITGLSPGNYTVTVTDFFGCTGSASVTVNSGTAFALVIHAQNVSTCGANDGSATAQPSGGTAPFTYLWNTGATTQTISNLSAGFYSVTATDANGCSKATTVTITEPPSLTASVNATPLVCNNANNGSATAFVNGGTAPFTYAWSNGGTTQTINNLGAGTYTVTVTDINGCQGTASATIGNSDLIIDAIITNVTCYGGSNGQIEVSGWNGTPPYTYQWSNGSTNPILSNIPAGNYSVTVYDSGNCSVSETITVTEPPMIVISFSTTQPGCTGGNGSATANVTGGTPGYTYAWSNGATGPTASNLPSGTYTVTVTDANLCTEVGAVNIIAAPPLSVSVNGNEPSCNGGNDGSATAQVFGGTPPFSYQWTNGGTIQTISNLTAGGYTVTITDAQGCTGVGNIWLNEPPNLNLMITASPQVCQNQSDGMATVFPNGGTPPYSYAWSTGSTAQMISGLSSGTYSVTVTDANNCVKTGSVTINLSDLILDVAKADVACFGESSGSILVSGWAGQPPYTYLWNTGATTPEITNLPVGTYTVTVTDAAGCQVTDDIIINQPPVINVSATSTPAGCSVNNGTATVTASGGVPPFTYAWNNFQTTQTISNLAPGTYSVTVQDANFCTKSTSVTVTGGSNFSVSINAVNVSCAGGNDGFAMAMPSGGQAPYTYLWSNGNTTNAISNLGSGFFSVTVTDALGCTGSANVTITEPAPITANVSTQNTTCGIPNGSATANVTSGGQAPFTYTWSNGGVGQTISNLTPGTFFVTITDSNNCQTTASGTVGSSPSVSVNITANNVLCFGGNDGSATASVSSGTAPYSYSWSNGGTTQTINNLTAGSYSVTVTDNDGCTANSSVSISEPSAVGLNLTKNDPTCGLNNGSATVNASGGTPGYTYAWSNGGGGQTINGLSAGTYSVTATDSNGCTKTGSVTLQGSSPITVTTLVISSTCVGANNGSASASATGGTAPYTYEWSTGDTGNTVFNLAAGTYTVTVTSSNGCTGTGSVLIPTSASPTCSAFVVQDPTTPNSNDGIAEASATGGTPPYTYLWSNGQTTKQATGLDEGTYSVTVTDFNGCTCVSSVTLVAPTGICVNVTDPGEICCNQTLCGPGNIPAPFTEITPATGGTGALEYLWMFSTNPGPFNQNTWTVIPGATGSTYAPGPIYETTYFIRCVRREFCTDYFESNIVTITIGNVAVADINGPTLVCVGDTETYTATASPGATYSWDFGSGASPQTSTNQTEDVTWSTWGVKTITLTVTKNGCVSTDELDINVTNNPIFCGNALVIEAEPLSQELVYVGWEFETALYDSLTFVVERSPDMVNFYPIGEMDFNPNSTNNRYKFYDQAPKKGRSFYRVRLIDPATGQETHSNTEEIKLTEGVSLVHVYPNPTTDFLYVEVMEDYGNEVSFEVYSANGILLENIVLAKDSFRQEIDLTNYPSGMYVFVLNFDGQRQKTIRLIKE